MVSKNVIYTMRKHNIWLGGLSLLFAANVALAKELLSGSIVLDNAEKLAFSLTGESRDNVVGGAIVLGDETFEITSTSRLGLIGATGGTAADGTSLEYLVFSSSFSAQTAVGNPWVASHRQQGCDDDYNSFAALYRIDEQQSASLGSNPYESLTNDVGLAREAVVYCFVSRPPN